MPEPRLALDSSASNRTIDQDGHLRVQVSNITKAQVSGYWGVEIPGGKALGLDPNRLYHLLRDPEELAKGAATFDGKPLLIPPHTTQTASDRDPELVVGAISNPTWDPPYIKAALSAWDAAAIQGILSREQRELSASYRFDADMTPGTYQGVHYDGVMRNIRGNHVLLTKEGRAGSDVAVGDAALNPKPQEPAMAKPLSRAALAASVALRAYLRPKLAQDAKIDLAPGVAGLTAKTWKAKKPVLAAWLKEVTKDKLAKDADLSDVVAMLDQLDDVTDEMADVSDPDAVVPKTGEDDDKDMGERVRAFCAGKMSDDDVAALLEMMKPEAAATPPAAKDVDPATKPPVKPAATTNTPEPTKEPPITKAAMDAAIKKAASDAENSTIARLAAIAAAEKDVLPYVGELVAAHDSAIGVYRTALDTLGVDHAGVTEIAALRLVLRAQPKPGEPVAPGKPRLAHDSAADKAFADRFPGAASLKHASR